MSALQRTVAAGPRRHLAIFLPALGGGGAEKMLLLLARQLIARDVRVDLVLIRHEGELLAEVPAGADVVHLHRRSPRGAIFALARYLRRARPDALISSLYRANVAAVLASKLARAATRVVIREANRTEFLIGTSTRQAKIDNFLLARVYPRADCIVAVSEDVARSLIGRGLAVPSRTRVIRNPLPTGDLEAARPAPVGDVALLVACGRLAPEKDHATLLRAFASLRRRTEAKLVILGEGPLRPALLSQAAELNIVDDVTLPGFVPDPQRYFRDATVFVHTSLFEGLPNAMLQALAAGCSIVATDCPGGVREVLADGRFGSLVPIGDHEAIAGAIEGILAGALKFPDPAEHLRNFNIERITDQYWDALFPTSGDDLSLAPNSTSAATV